MLIVMSLPAAVPALVSSLVVDQPLAEYPVAGEMEGVATVQLVVPVDAPVALTLQEPLVAPIAET